MANEIQDTYFLDANRALEEAKKQNTHNFIEQVDRLQICYYNAQEPFEDAPKNCIFVPFENMYSYFLNTRNRFPTLIACDGTDYTIEEQKELSIHIEGILTLAQKHRDEALNAFIQKAKNLKPNFNDEKLRVFLPTCRETTVLQYVSRDVADAFEEDGRFEVKYYVQDNAMQSCDSLAYLYELCNFNPHITFNINHFNNEFLNDDVFNFIWYQDPMPVLTDGKKAFVRKRDYFLSAIELFTDNLIKKEVSTEKITTQPFGYSPKTFFIHKDIKKENKIVFIGSYYTKKRTLPHLHNDIKLYDICAKHIEEGKSLSTEFINKICKKYNYPNVNSSDIAYIQQDIIRFKCVEWATSIKDINFELYGYLWDKTKHKDIYKGSLTKQEVCNVYNSSKYVLLASGQTINTQRLAETIACGAIPVVYDSRDITDEKEHWDDEILYFKTKDELEHILKNNLEPKKKISQKMKDYFSYESTINKIYDVISNDTEGWI